MRARRPSRCARGTTQNSHALSSIFAVLLAEREKKRVLMRPPLRLSRGRPRRGVSAGRPAHACCASSARPRPVGFPHVGAALENTTLPATFSLPARSSWALSDVDLATPPVFALIYVLPWAVSEWPYLAGQAASASAATKATQVKRAHLMHAAARRIQGSFRQRREAARARCVVPPAVRADSETHSSQRETLYAAGIPRAHMGGGHREKGTRPGREQWCQHCQCI